MFKRFAVVSSLVTVLVTPFVWAQSQIQSPPHPYTILSGLERFDPASRLPMNTSGFEVQSSLSIKGVKIGDNVLDQAIKLDEQGGLLGRIRGGTRSDKVKFSFYQAYQNSRLEQKVELYFDKFNGFIRQVTATYVLQDAYLSIVPIREQTLNAAVARFGSPLTMEQVYARSGQNDGDVDLDKFVRGLQKDKQLHPLAQEYFQKRNISRSTKWVKGEQNYALMHSGFDRCYLWQTNTFNQILTFCFFDKSGANPNSRGVELDLHNFPIEQQIKDLGNPSTKPDILL